MLQRPDAPLPASARRRNNTAPTTTTPAYNPASTAKAPQLTARLLHKAGRQRSRQPSRVPAAATDTRSSQQDRQEGRRAGNGVHSRWEVGCATGCCCVWLEAGRSTDLCDAEVMAQPAAAATCMRTATAVHMGMRAAIQSSLFLAWKNPTLVESPPPRPRRHTHKVVP